MAFPYNTNPAIMKENGYLLILNICIVPHYRDHISFEPVRCSRARVLSQ